MEREPAAVYILPVVLLRTPLGGLSGSRQWRISAQTDSQYLVLMSHHNATKWVIAHMFSNCFRARNTHVPCLSPMRQIMMIYSPLECDMLSDADDHVLRRRHVDHRWLHRIGRGNP